ncbi:MAG: D-glucuronyl C5-epimerase family protein [Gaiellales bacterium]
MLDSSDSRGGRTNHQRCSFGIRVATDIPNVPDMDDPRSDIRFSASPRRMVGLLLLVLASLLIAVPSASAATKDPVVRAINMAQKKQAINYRTAKQLRKDWSASARAARNARTLTRRATIRGVRTQTTSLARRKLLTPERVEPALLSVKATTWVMLRGSYPSHEQTVTIPGEPLVFKFYSGRGVQLQPFETLKQGMREINAKTPNVEKAREIADRLLDLHVRRGSSYIWEYYFAFGGPDRPWTSSISQALATEFFWRVGMLAPEEERASYLDAAWGANESFLRSSRAGGVSTNEADGRFYVMYPFAPAQRILNGHLQVLINVSRYAEWSGNERARRVVEQGLEGAYAVLPKFDTGAWSNYQPGQEADIGYHRFQTEQLVKLGKELEDPTFVDYGDRFSLYLVTPPNLGVRGSSWRTIIPSGDGYRDTARIAFDLDKRARVTMVVRDQLMREVLRQSIWRSRGRSVIAWNGKTNSGTIAPDGEYLVSFTVTDILGNRSTAHLPSTLSVEADVVPPELRLVTVRARGARTLVTVDAADIGSRWIDIEVRVGGKVLARKRGRRDGSTNVLVPARIGKVQRGSVILRDSSGNETKQPLAG